MSQYDLMLYLKIKLCHGDLYFMVLWFLPYILKAIWCINMILWANKSVWLDAWPQNKSWSLWPIFHGSVAYILKTILCIRRWHWPGVYVSPCSLALVFMCTRKFKESLTNSLVQITVLNNYRKNSKYWDMYVWANSLDSDQTALKEQSDQDLHCLPFFLHLLEALLHCKIKRYYIKDNYGSWSGCPNI